MKFPGIYRVLKDLPQPGKVQPILIQKRTVILCDQLRRIQKCKSGDINACLNHMEQLSVQIEERVIRRKIRIDF